MGSKDIGRREVIVGIIMGGGNALCNKEFLWSCFSFGMNYCRLIRVMERTDLGDW